MYKRNIELINDFSYHSPYTIAQLASQYQVSVQTIRNDINAINQMLSECNCEKIQIKSGSIIYPENFANIKKYINQKITESPFYFYHLSKEELCTITIIILIFSKKYVTINQLCEMLFVSRTTFINSSSELHAQTATLGLTVHTSSNKGIILKNTESEKRNALITLIKHLANENEFLLNIILKSNIVTRQDFRKNTQKIIYKFQNIYKFSLSHHDFVILNYYLNFLIARIEKGNFVEYTANKNSLFYCSQEIMVELCKTFQLPAIESETYFLSDLLNEILAPAENNNSSLDIMMIQILTTKLIKNISNCLDIDLTQDFQLLEGLSSHLISVYSSTDCNNFENSILDEVRNNHPIIIAAVKDNIQSIEKYYHRTFCDTEIIYIAIHFCAAIERYRADKYNYRALVACNAGTGTSQLTKAKLFCLSNITVIRTVSSWEISSLSKDDGDLLISTIPIYQSPIPFINISANVTDQDLILISNKIREMYNTGILPGQSEITNSTLQKIIANIQPVIYEFVPQKKEEAFQRIQEIIYATAKHMIPAHNEIRTPHLYQLLTPEFIQLNISCNDWKDSIYKSAHSLLNAQYFTENYLKEIINITETYGAYYIIADGVALLHASPKNDVKKLGISLTRFSSPVLFYTQEGTQSINYAILLSVLDKKTHVHALFSLMNLLKTPAFMEQLSNADTPENVYQLIYQNEKRLLIEKGDF